MTHWTQDEPDLRRFRDVDLDPLARNGFVLLRNRSTWTPTNRKRQSKRLGRRWFILGSAHVRTCRGKRT